MSTELAEAMADVTRLTMDLVWERETEEHFKQRKAAVERAQRLWREENS